MMEGIEDGRNEVRRDGTKVGRTEKREEKSKVDRIKQIQCKVSTVSSIY